MFPRLQPADGKPVGAASLLAGSASSRVVFTDNQAERKTQSTVSITE